MTWRCIALAALVVLSGCCGGRPLIVTQPPIAPVTPSGELRAAVAEADITPPPGLPTFGYSIAGKVSEGYWTRLKARVLAFESPDGRRLALVQLDLGASSALLGRLVAQRLAGEGLGPADVVLLSTHTHAGPGAYFGSCSYNAFGAKKSGFDERFVTSMADHIKDAASYAFAHLAPAVICVGITNVLNVTRNRSADAWQLNNPRPPYNEILPRLVVLRIDRKEASSTRPMAALIFFPIHGTSVGPDNRLNHGDLHGVAVRLASARLQRDYNLSDRVIVAFADGPEGDVSPDWTQQGFPEARRLGGAIADAAVHVFEGMDGLLRTASFSSAYAEAWLPGAPTSAGALCREAESGASELGGAEDGRTWLYHLGFKEGARGPDRRCQGRKKRAFGALQGLLIKPEDFPQIAPMHAVRFENLLTIVTVPGEPTTETGRRIGEAVQQVVHTPVVVAAHGDDYLGYVTTPEEYDQQDYEGGSTLYGPREAVFFSDQLTALASKLGQPSVPPAMERVFHPGKAGKFGDSGPCDEDQWAPIETKVTRDSTDAARFVTFRWRGLAPGHVCDPLPAVSIESQGRPLIGPSGQLENDDWLNFEVRRKGNEWTATWLVPPRTQCAAPCRIRVERRNHPPLLSDAFTP